MDIISIIFIIIIIFFTIFGLAKGFIKTILIFSKGIISFIVASVFCSSLGSLLMLLPFVNSWNTSFATSLENKSIIFSQTVYADDTDLISSALNELNIPSFLSNILAKKIEIPSTGAVLSTCISSQLIHMIMVLIAFIILLIGTRLILFILRKIISKIVESVSPLKFLNRTLGGILGCIMGLVIIWVTCYVFSILITIPALESFSNYLTSQMKLDSNTFTISKFFYEHNLLLYFFGNL